MTKLVSMKITEAERKAKQKEYEKGPVSIGGDTFPYGLQIRLENDALEKLGIDNLPKTGRKVRVVAECTVTSTSEHKSSHGGKTDKRRNLELQIEKLALNLEAGSALEAVDDALES